MTARSRAWRVIFEIAVPGLTRITSLSGTWPSVFDGTWISCERARIVAELLRGAQPHHVLIALVLELRRFDATDEHRERVRDVGRVDAEHRGAIEIGPNRGLVDRIEEARVEVDDARDLLHLGEHLLAVLLELVEIGPGDRRTTPSRSGRRARSR